MITGISVLLHLSNSAFKTEVYDPNATGVNLTTDLESKITVFPNPTEGPVYIQLPAYSPKPEMIYIFNCHGQLVFEKQNPGFKNQQLEINTQLMSGVYFWYIRINGDKKSGKIIIK